ncbi:hypothetical protein HOY80DRAFT_963633 [Tuber brumale]|nr:hypothetical protein HOY80DRAFT_963633 [Tuber brumale]
MGTHHPNYTLSPSFADYCHSTESDIHLLPYDVIMVVEDSEMGFSDHGQSNHLALNVNELSSLAALLQPQDNLAHAFIPRDGFSNAIYDNSTIDPNLLHTLDAGAKMVAKIVIPPVVDEPPKGNDHQRLRLSPPDPIPHTPDPSEEKSKLGKISKAQRSKRSRPPIHCDIGGCGKQYGRRSDLRRHLLVNHMKGGGGNCWRCGIFINRKDNLRKHELSLSKACLKRMEDIRQGLICF